MSRIVAARPSGVRSSSSRRVGFASSRRMSESPEPGVDLQRHAQLGCLPERPPQDQIPQRLGAATNRFIGSGPEGNRSLVQSCPWVDGQPGPVGNDRLEAEVATLGGIAHGRLDFAEGWP